MEIKYRDGSARTIDKIKYQANHSVVADNSTVLALIDKIKEQEETIEKLEDKISDYQDYARGVAERRD